MFGNSIPSFEIEIESTYCVHIWSTILISRLGIELSNIVCFITMDFVSQ